MRILRQYPSNMHLAPDRGGPSGKRPPKVKMDRLTTLVLPSMTPVVIRSIELNKLKESILDAMRAREKHSEAELVTLEEAFNLMIPHHRDEIHSESGERTAIHLLQTAQVLAEWGAPASLVAAALIYLMPLSKLRVSNIDMSVVEIVRKKKVLEQFLFSPIEGRFTERESRYLTKMCLMLEGNRDVWLLEAADEFATLSAREKKGLVASRAYHITSRMLGLFDLDHLAVKLENIALFRLDKDEYDRNEALVEDANRVNRREAMDNLRALTDLINQELKSVAIECRVHVDVKSAARTKRKLAKGDQLTDASRFRYIIKGTKGDCVKAMETIVIAMHDLGYTEIAAERKNYMDDVRLQEGTNIGSKENGYQSIHLHFRGPRNEPINVQIRTEEMHEIAELGTASHGRFKLDGLMNASTIAEASLTRQALIAEGRKHGFHEGKIYRLIPYPPEGKITILDLAFAISPDHGLRCPENVAVKRIDPQTGKKIKLKARFSDKLQNGDEVVFNKSRKVFQRRAQIVGTLPAALIMKMEKELDPKIRELRSSEAMQRGKIAIKTEVTEWFATLRETLQNELDLAKLGQAGFKIDVSTSLDRTAKMLNLTSVEQLDLAAGLLGNQKGFIDRILTITRNSTVATTYHVLDNEANLWFFARRVPGVFPAILKLLSDKNVALTSCSVAATTSTYSLVKVNVRSRKKRDELSKDVLAIISASENLYAPTRPNPEPTPLQTIKIKFGLNRCNLVLATKILETVTKMGARLISADLGDNSQAGKKTCKFCVGVPTHTIDTYKLGLEQSLKSIQRKVGWMRLSNFKMILD